MLPLTSGHTETKRKEVRIFPKIVSPRLSTLSKKVTPVSHCPIQRCEKQQQLTFPTHSTSAVLDRCAWTLFCVICASVVAGAGAFQHTRTTHEAGESGEGLDFGSDLQRAGHRRVPAAARGDLASSGCPSSAPCGPRLQKRLPGGVWPRFVASNPRDDQKYSRRTWVSRALLHWPETHSFRRLKAPKIDSGLQGHPADRVSTSGGRSGCPVPGQRPQAARTPLQLRVSAPLRRGWAVTRVSGKCRRVRARCRGCPRDGHGHTHTGRSLPLQGRTRFRTPLRPSSTRLFPTEPECNS